MKGFISMRTDMSNAGRPAYYTVREAAWILGVKPPRPMDGRVLTEALTIDGPKIGAPKTTRIEAAHQKQKSVWRQYLQRTEWNGVIYLDEGNGGLEPR